MRSSTRRRHTLSGEPVAVVWGKECGIAESQWEWTYELALQGREACCYQRLFDQFEGAGASDCLAALRIP